MRSQVVQSKDVANCPVCNSAFVVREEYPCAAEEGPHYDSPKTVRGYVLDLTDPRVFTDWETQHKTAFLTMPAERNLWAFENAMGGICCVSWEEPEPWDEEMYCPKCDKSEWELERASDVSSARDGSEEGTNGR